MPGIGSRRFLFGGLMDEILKALSETPDLIDGYTSEQVTEARAALTEFVAAVKSGEQEADSEALAEAKALAEQLDARMVAIDAEVEARDAEILALETALGVTVEKDKDEEEDDDDDDGADPVEIEITVPESEAVEEEKELVTASAKPSTRKIAALIPKERQPRQEAGPHLVASASGFEGREVLTAAAFGEIALKRWTGMGSQNPATQSFHSIAQFETKNHKYSVVKGDDDGNSRVLAEVAREASEEGNLVASGGFCAPPEQLYNFFNIASRAGILSLPTVNAPRGSINLPISPSFGDFFGESGIAFEWTDENDVELSPATKPVYVFDCPDFQTCEVSAWPTILQFGNFASRFYPEAIANATALALIAADRTLNAARINFLRTGATAGVLDATSGGGLINLSRNLSSNATLYRQTYAMDPNAILEVVLPHWVPRALWGDAIARGSTVDYSDLSRRVNGIFAENDLRPSFVYDFDDVVAGTFPETTDALIYAPGTVVELDGGTLDLGVVRDSTLNSTNDYQVFAEPFVGWCQPGHDVVLVDEIPICENGAVGAAVTVSC